MLLPGRPHERKLDSLGYEVSRTIAESHAPCPPLLAITQRLTFRSRDSCRNRLPGSSVHHLTCRLPLRHASATRVIAREAFAGTVPRLRRQSSHEYGSGGSFDIRCRLRMDRPDHSRSPGDAAPQEGLVESCFSAGVSRPHQLPASQALGAPPTPNQSHPGSKAAQGEDQESPRLTTLPRPGRKGSPPTSRAVIDSMVDTIILEPAILGRPGYPPAGPEAWPLGLGYRGKNVRTEINTAAGRSLPPASPGITLPGALPSAPNPRRPGLLGW